MNDLLADLKNRFTYHRPDAETVTRHEQLRKSYYELSIMLTQLVPDSDERGTALTHLENSLMWANAGIARHPMT
jgi:hypothetical protein